MRTRTTATASLRTMAIICRLCRYSNGESAKATATTRSKYKCRRFGKILAAASGPLLMIASSPRTPPPATRTAAGRPLM
jgi:hypothetical protein